MENPNYYIVVDENEFRVILQALKKRRRYLGNILNQGKVGESKNIINPEGTKENMDLIGRTVSKLLTQRANQRQKDSSSFDD